MNEYKNLSAILIKIGQETRDKYKAKLKEKNKYASGKLYNSIDYKIEITDTSCKLYFVAEKYWINIEEGRKAGDKMPPISVIKKWIISKNIKPKTTESLSGMAMRISRSIGKKGIKPNPFLRDIQKGLTSYSDDIAKALELDVKEEIKKIETKVNNKK